MSKTCAMVPLSNVEFYNVETDKTITDEVISRVSGPESDIDPMDIYTDIEFNDILDAMEEDAEIAGTSVFTTKDIKRLVGIMMADGDSSSTLVTEVLKQAKSQLEGAEAAVFNAAILTWKAVNY